MYNKLNKIKLFQGISKNTINKIERMNCIIKNYNNDELVFEKDEEIKYFNIIIEGILKTNEYMIDGKEVVSSYYFKNDAFPMYLIYGGEKFYPYNVYSYKKSKVLHMPIEDLKECLDSDIDFLKNTLRFVSEYTCYNKMIIRATQDNRVIKRLAYWILNSGNNNTIKIPGNQTVLADILRVNRCVLNQSLKELERDKAIKVLGKEIRILNRDYIKKLQE